MLFAAVLYVCSNTNINDCQVLSHPSIFNSEERCYETIYSGINYFKSINFSVVLYECVKMENQEVNF